MTSYLDKLIWAINSSFTEDQFKRQVRQFATWPLAPGSTSLTGHLNFSRYKRRYKKEYWRPKGWDFQPAFSLKNKKQTKKKNSAPVYSKWQSSCLQHYSRVNGPILWAWSERVDFYNSKRWEWLLTNMYHKNTYKCMIIWERKISPAFNMLVWVGIREGFVKDMLSELDPEGWIIFGYMETEERKGIQGRGYRMNKAMKRRKRKVYCRKGKAITCIEC